MHDHFTKVFLGPGFVLGNRRGIHDLVVFMKQFFEVQFGKYSCYVLADDEEQAGQNVDGMLEDLYNGGAVFVTGQVADKAVDATDEAVAEMLRESGRLN